MCLAIPARIESLEGEKATVDLAGARATAVTTLTPQVKVGDWVLIHAGYAITVLDEKDARETFAILREMENPPQSTQAAVRRPKGRAQRTQR